MTNKYNTTLYTGVTSGLKKRVYKHKLGIGSFFPSRYKLNKLVWFEEYPTIQQAIESEKQIKNWRRPWKMNLIKSMKPELRDLYEEL